MISRLTAATIQCNDELIYTYGYNKKTNKYSGWITLGPDRYCRPLLNSECIFDTSEEAVKNMTDLRDKLRAMPSAFSKEFDEYENTTGY